MPPQRQPPRQPPRASLTPRSFFDRPVLDVAPALLGHVIEHETTAGLVAVLITEVEAYAGEVDPASHAYRGLTRRNAVMFGPPGHAYVYFTYGMHFCANLVCQDEGTAAAVLLRAGRVLSGVPIARARRAAAAGTGDRYLASGPARLCQALGIDRALDGADVCDPASPLRVRQGETVSPGVIRSGPRTGIRAAAEVPWRFWVAAEPTVSPYRAHAPRSAAGRGTASTPR
ncbi:MAG TPA: DNA-3-methyladenine glycosylase [Streptosporangiaceae bacterium]|nr:DNA-3-methyladenine glycosylase [Streptosporangiaceae bacterium]